MRSTHPDKHDGEAALELSKILNDAKDRALERLEEAAQLKNYEEAARLKKKEEKAARLKKKEEEAARLKKKEEESAQLKKKEEEATLLKKKEEQASRRKKKEEEASRQKKQEEEAISRKRQEEEAASRKKKTDEIQKRLQTKKREMSCIAEFKLHAQGQEAGLYRLKRVCQTILKEYQMPADKLEPLLMEAGLYTEWRSGSIKKMY